MRSTIICVDDEKMLLNILAEQLTQWFGSRYNIEKSLSGEDALSILDECMANGSEVSLIISDYVMPNMRGDELLSKVSKRDPRIRKIMLTGYSSVEGIANAINNGGLYRYITKPWDTKDLMLTIVEAIRSYETERKNADLTKGFESMYKKYESLYLESQRNLENAIDVLKWLSQLREPGMMERTHQVAEYMQKFIAQLNIPNAQHKHYMQMVNLCEVGCAGLSDLEVALLRKGDDSKVLEMRKQLMHKVNSINHNVLSKLVLPDFVKCAILNQYERMDGSGPMGLIGAQIPREAYMLSFICAFVDEKTELTDNNAYTKENIMGWLNKVIKKHVPSEIAIPFVEIIKADF